MVPIPVHCSRLRHQILTFLCLMSSPGANGNGLSLVQTARTEFHVLLRKLTTHSSQGRGTEVVFPKDKDVEKGPFNLQDCFTSFDEANRSDGTQRKQVGVTWEDLQVVVPGDKNNKVK